MAKRPIVKPPTAAKPPPRKQAFDPAVFLKTEGPGRTIGKYRKDQQIFSQGGPADVLFYIITGTVKIVVHSEQGKEAVIALLGQDDFSAKAAWPASLIGCRRRRSSRTAKSCGSPNRPR